MSVSTIHFADDGLLGDARDDARLQAMGRRLGQANDRIEALEDKLVAARTAVKHAKTARSAAERELQRARTRVVTAAREVKATEHAGQFTVDGVQRLAVNKTDAARALGVSVEFFDAHVAHDLKCVRRGRRRLFAVVELQRWLEQEGESVGAAGYAS